MINSVSQKLEIQAVPGMDAAEPSRLAPLARGHATKIVVPACFAIAVP
jgi:hypothetical protein